MMLRASERLSVNNFFINIYMADDPEKLRGEDRSAYANQPVSRERAISGDQQEAFDKYVEARVNELRFASNEQIVRAMETIAQDKNIRQKVGYSLSHRLTKAVKDELEKQRKARKRR